jgi:glutathione S-transferase
LFGESTLERAKIEMWARRVDLNFLMPVAQGFRNLTGYYKDRETCVKEWGEVSTLAARDTAVLLDAHLANNQFLLGDRYAIPDMTLAIVMGFAKNVGQDFFDLPNLSRFYAVVTARAAFQ